MPLLRYEQLPGVVGVAFKTSATVDYHKIHCLISLISHNFDQYWLQDWAGNGITDFSYNENAPTLRAFTSDNCTGEFTTGQLDTDYGLYPMGLRSPIPESTSCRIPGDNTISLGDPVYTLAYAFGDNTIKSVLMCKPGKNTVIPALHDMMHSSHGQKAARQYQSCSMSRMRGIFIPTLILRIFEPEQHRADL